MRSFKVKSYFLGIFFILAVMLPAVILSLLAFKTALYEEAYAEKRLKAAFQTEITYVASLINAELENVKKELNAAISLTEEQDYRYALSLWKKRSAFVEFPFLLNPKREFIVPDSQEELPEKELSFLNSNTQFFNDKNTTPVYQNIAVAYRQEILDASSWMGKSQRSSANYTAFSAAADKATNKNAAENPAELEANKQIESQVAASSFEQYEPIRKKVYEKAQSEGQQIFYRRVTPVSDIDQKKISKAKTPPPESQFISEDQTFSQIIANLDYGIIPRFLNDKLRLIFWKKNEKGFVYGCLIQDARLREKIIGVLPDIYTPARILTVLDETGKPLLAPVLSKGRSLDWRSPFVAAEINEILPHWEVAAYLSAPETLASQVRITTMITWILIFILFISILSGGTLVLRSLFSQMRLAQQKTTFVTNVSHELKTPLTSIRLFAELLKGKRQPDENKQQQYLDIMVSETERLTRLINNVLDFARIEEGRKSYNLKLTDIAGLSREIVENQKVRLEQNGFKLSFICRQENISIKADEESFKQAMINLLSNAEKYSGQIKDIEVEIYSELNEAVADIKDRGIGISAREAKKIFKEFYRVDDRLTARVKGTGLGLTIARRIIRDFGGDIRYYPREGGGSIFQIRLPISEMG